MPCPFAVPAPACARSATAAWLAACCGLLLAWAPGATPARAAAQEMPRLEMPPPRPPALPPLELPQPEPLQAPGAGLAPALEPAGALQPEPLSVLPEQDPALARDIAQLRASASRPGKRGSASERQAARAAWTLGLLALHGRGGPVDAPQAEQWFERARALGEPLAPAGLAWCRIDGCTPPPNPAAARPFIAQLRSADAGRALYLEWLVQARQTPLQIAQPQPPGAAPTAPGLPAHALLTRAAQAGDAQALVELGLESVSQGRLPEALELFRRAQARSPAAAVNAQRLAERLQSMDSERRPPAARTAQDWFLLARRYHRGDGVPANYAEAIRLYQVAAAAGSRPAQHMLGLIYAHPGPAGGVDIAWMQQLAALDVDREDGSKALVAPLPTLPAVSPQLYVRDPTPLYDLLPARWRAAGRD